jgi:hypothetical protein
MAEVNYSTNGKGNLGVTLGAIGTGLGLFSNGLSGILGNGNVNNVRWVSQNEYEQGQKISSLESQNALLTAEKNTDTKMIEVYERLDTKYRNLEKELATFSASQGVINAQVTANLAVAQNNIASLQTELSSLTKTVIPIDNVCPNPMARYNSWTAPTTSTTS